MFWSDKVLKLKEMVIAHTVNILNASELHILKWLTVMLCEFHLNLKKKKTSTVVYIMPLNQP